MSAIKTVIFCCTAVIVITLINGQSNDLVNRDCLNCICEASSRCNASIGCFQPYSGSNFCGAFGISFEYWIDAGKPIIRDDNPEAETAFINCATDLYCAADTVHRYMKLFSETGDCNGDGVVDCADFAHIHHFGGYSCTNANVSTTSEFHQKFESCWNEVKPATSDAGSTSVTTNAGSPSATTDARSSPASPVASSPSATSSTRTDIISSSAPAPPVAISSSATSSTRTDIISSSAPLVASSPSAASSITTDARSSSAPLVASSPSATSSTTTDARSSSATIDNRSSSASSDARSSEEESEARSF